ncbi:conserved hypothetical protein [Beggiatoa sp. SS]|nr:conserved hypothetical protein [Beggiatoa sp. SS]
MIDMLVDNTITLELNATPDKKTVSEKGEETGTAEEKMIDILVDDTIDSAVNATTDKPFIKRIKADDSGGYYFNLCIPAKEVHDYPPLKEFIEFVTETVVDELLQAVAVKVEAVDTVVVSGRGALWPGLRQRVWDKFKHIEDNDRVRKPDLSDSNQAKNAVVSGAIAWQQLSNKTIKPEEPDIKARFAILRQQHQRLILEDEWDKRDERGEEIPIDLNATDSF